MASHYPTRREVIAAMVSTYTLTACAKDNNASNTSSNNGTKHHNAPHEPLDFDTGVGKAPFLLGVASGDPLEDSVILWTRLVSDLTVDGFSQSGETVEWTVATDNEFEHVVSSGSSQADPNWAHCVHVDVKGLQPNSWYFYRFKHGDDVSPIGRTRTLPDKVTTPDELKFAFASCQDYANGFYSAYKAMAQDNLDLVLFLGDYIYEYPAKPGDIRSVGPDNLVTVEQYRRRYATYKSDKNLQAAHAQCPWVVTWDDHEVENNYSNLVSDSDSGEKFVQKRISAYKAYYEHQPMRLDPPKDENWQIYRSFEFGDLASFFMLDGRQYRSDQPCKSPQDAFVQIDKCPDLDASDRTMLGSDQESWLGDGLTKSKTLWNVLGQQTVMSPLILGTLILNVDQWDGYPAARQRFIESLDDVKNLIVLTGDIHSAGAGVLNKQNGQPYGVEFVGTSITSASLADQIPGGAETVKPGSIPSLLYVNVKDHGYCRCTVTPKDWTSEYVVVADIREPDSGSRIDAILKVDVGSNALRIVS